MPTARTAPAISNDDRFLPARQRSRFSAQWFRQIAEDERVAQLGAHPERVLSHLLAAPMRRSAARVSFERMYLADSAVVVACVDGQQGAWAMLDEHAPLLERALLGLTEGEHPHVIARRFLDSVRRATERNQDHGLNLRRYSGERPIRVWLGDRLIAAHADAFRRLRVPTTSRRLRLAFELIETKREKVRAVFDAMEAAPASGRLLGEPN